VRVDKAYGDELALQVNFQSARWWIKEKIVFKKKNKKMKTNSLKI